MTEAANLYESLSNRYQEYAQPSSPYTIKGFLVTRSISIPLILTELAKTVIYLARAILQTLLILLKAPCNPCLKKYRLPKKQLLLASYNLVSALSFTIPGLFSSTANYSVRTWMYARCFPSVLKETTAPTSPATQTTTDVPSNESMETATPIRQQLSSLKEEEEKCTASNSVPKEFTAPTSPTTQQKLTTTMPLDESMEMATPRPLKILSTPTRQQLLSPLDANNKLDTSSMLLTPTVDQRKEEEEKRIASDIELLKKTYPKEDGWGVAQKYFSAYTDFIEKEQDIRDNISTIQSNIRQGLTDMSAVLNSKTS